MSLLVVGHEKPSLIDLDKGALKVCVTGQSPAWAPLRRLTGVVSYPAAQWSSPALLACARKAVGVVFCTGGGQFMARFGPLKGTDQKVLNDLLMRELDWFLQARQGQQMVRHWLSVRCRRWRQLATLVQQRGTGAKALRPKPAKQKSQTIQGFRAGTLKANGCLLSNGVSLVSAIAACVVDEMQRHYGLRDAQLGFQLSGFSLAEGMIKLVDWRFLAVCPGRKRKSLDWVEKKARQICRDELVDLHRFLLENRHELENNLPDLL